MIADEINALIIKAKCSKQELEAISKMIPKWQKDVDLHLVLIKQEEELYGKDPEEPYWNR